ncbi:M6 family metalloprotease domain-containing protein [Streptomyces antimycoticus]|uniref:M6 family metalloprotease domain-containing protein n=1 Tax=Streptomyces antimycoticus TaxID=68175 RepID=UPI000A3A5033|nr:M6 family metalloprotease domain-containing protein [Streptomyces antimycoticus]
MVRPQVPEGVHRQPRLRRTGALLTSLSALIATTVVAGPAVAAGPGGPCDLERTDAHHSEGLDTWNSRYPRPVRRLDAAMVFLSFPDAKPRVTPARLAADHVPATPDFFKRASYGKFALRVHPLRRWLTMPQRSTAYAIQRDWNAKSRAAYLRDAIASADPHLDFGRYDLVYLVADPDAPGVDADATKVVNFEKPLRADGVDLRRLVTVFEHHPPDRNVLAHETGHVFDLPDLYHRPKDTDASAEWDTYVGDWDLMGSQFGMAPDPFGWHKWKLGWLGARQIACAARSGVFAHTLSPLNRPEGTKLVFVPVSPSTGYAIEARASGGNDEAICKPGVLISRVDTGVDSGGGPVTIMDSTPHGRGCTRERNVHPGLSDAAYAPGEIFRTETNGLRIRVRVTGRDAAGDFGVEITRRASGGARG